MKKRILILNGQYAPGYKGGGPIQSCINMVDNLSDEYEFYVLCADRDHKCDTPYENICVNNWNDVGDAKVFYMGLSMLNIKGFRKILEGTDFDVLYLNGFFSPIFTIIPLLLRRIGYLKNCKIILTPRGDFTGGCENKRLKKYSYILFSKLFGIYKGITWHATSKIEEYDIKKKFPNAKIFMVPNLSPKFVPKEPTNTKKPNELKLVFVSRIFPKKNLKFALEVLKDITEGNVIFDIYGPIEDKNYWDKCESIIKELPSNIKVTYGGEVPHHNIQHVFEKYHAFFFPTLGENFGHVIVEAMMSNCLVILPKGVTPWDDYGAMLNLFSNLIKKKGFIDIINMLLALDDVEYKKMVSKSNKYIQKNTDLSSFILDYIRLLDSGDCYEENFISQ